MIRGTRRTAVLGFSGLALHKGFREARLPGLDSYERRIFQGADAAAALVLDGRVVAAASEERFDGVKHSSAFPRGAAGHCLDAGGLTAAGLDLVAHSFSYAEHRDFYEGQSPYYRDLYASVLAPEANQRVAEQALGVDLRGRFRPVPHHLAHAASAYFPSGYQDALVVVSDGLGERQSASVFAAEGGQLLRLAEIPAHSSMGQLYGLFTLYLGFEFGDGEYKVMGLAPLGDPERYLRVILDRWIELAPEGRYHVPLLLENVSDLDKETYRAALAAVEKELGPRRRPGDPIGQRHKDVAAGLQAALQTVQLHLLGHFRRQTGLNRLCLAGGVALNCVVNGLLLRSGLFEEIFVQPAAGDDGAALGAALLAAQELGEQPSAPAGTNLGPQYSADRCRQAVEEAGLSGQTTADDEALVAETARVIADGGVVGWFQGAMEFGPRALGNRSILADPRRAEMRDHINALVKKREAFRPFAPAVLAEAAPGLFEIDPDDVPRFAAMLFVAYVRPEHAARLPATTHVDGSARLQTVSRSDNPLFWQLLTEFGELTGTPAVLNTSFNVRGQPIVRTPEQAVATFLDAGLDALVIGRTIVRRPEEAPAKRRGER